MWSSSKGSSKSLKSMYVSFSNRFCVIIIFHSIKDNDKRSAVRMMIWLCVYYEFYCIKVHIYNCIGITTGKKQLAILYRKEAQN